MADKKNLGIIIAYGGEVRSVIYSGLLEILRHDYNITIFSFRDISNYSPILSSVTLLPFPQDKEMRFLEICRRLSNSIHNYWFEKQGGKRWSYTIKYNYDVDTWRKWRAFFLRTIASKTFVSTFSQIERFAGSNWGTCNAWRDIFSSHQIDALLSFSFESHRVLPALQTAQNLGLPIFLFMHSWKDAYKKPHLSNDPKKILVWAQRHVDMVSFFNPWIAKSKFSVVGSLHLAPFQRLTGLLPKDEFFRETGLDPRRPFICYTAADPRTALNEENLVACLLQAIRSKMLPQDFQLLLRLNPVEDGRRFVPLMAKFEGDLVVQYPKWEWHPELSWICQLPEDTALWVSSAYYSSMNISLPSTVTLEFGALKKPVINICFDLPKAPFPEASNRRYWFSDWYAEIREMKIALPAFDEAELFVQIEKAALSDQTFETLNKDDQNNWLFKDAVLQSKVVIDYNMKD